MDDWVFLREGADGSDSDDSGGGSSSSSSVRVPGGIDSASEDGSDSGFAIVTVRKDLRANCTASPTVDGGDAPAPAIAAAPPPPTPPGLFKVVSYGEAFSAGAAAASSSTEGGGESSGFLDETTIREALFGGATGIDGGDGLATQEEDCESEVGEHGSAGSSVEAPAPTSSVLETSIVSSPCDALPEVAGGMEEEEDAQSFGGEEEGKDTESSGNEEDYESGQEEEDVECPCCNEKDTENSGEVEEEDIEGACGCEEDEDDEESSGEEDSETETETSGDEEDDDDDDDSSSEEDSESSGEEEDTENSGGEEDSETETETSGDEESSESEVGEQGGAGSSVEVPSPLSLVLGSTVSSPCDALPEVAGGMEEEEDANSFAGEEEGEENMESSGNEEDYKDSGQKEDVECSCCNGDEDDNMEDSGEEEDIETETETSADEEDDDDDDESSSEEDDMDISDQSSGEEDAEISGEEEDDDESSSEEDDMDISDESSGEEDAEISGEEEDGFDESSSEDCFEIPATRQSTSTNPAISYEDDSKHGYIDMTPPSRMIAEQDYRAIIRLVGDVFNADVHNNNTEQMDSDEDGGIDVDGESTKPSGLVGHGYDDVDSGSDVEESASVPYALHSTEARTMIYRSLYGYESLLQSAARDLQQQVRMSQLTGCVGRGYDDVDSGSDVEPEESVEVKPSGLVGRSYDESSGDEDDMDNSGDEDAEISGEEEEEEDGFDETSSEDCFEIPATRHSTSTNPAISDEDESKHGYIDMTPSSRMCRFNAEQDYRAIIRLMDDAIYADGDNDNNSDEDGGIDVEGESTKPSGLVGRGYDDVDSGSDVEESASVAYDMDSTEPKAIIKVYWPIYTYDFLLERAARELQQQVRMSLLTGCAVRGYDDVDSGSDVELEESVDVEVKPLGFVGRSYDDVDSVEPEESVEVKPSGFVGCSYDDVDSGSSDVEPEPEESVKVFVGRGYDDVDSGSDVEESVSVACDLDSTGAKAMIRAYMHIYRYEFLLQRAYMEESDCDPEEEEEEDVEEEEESFCEDEHGTDCAEEDDSDDDIGSDDEEENDNEAAYDVSPDAGESIDDDDDDDDTVHYVCGQCGHVVQISKRPVEFDSINYAYLDPQAVIRPANVICKNGKPIFIVYDDDDDGTNCDEEEAPGVSGTAGAESPTRGSAGSRRVVMAEDTMEVKDLLLEMVEEFEAAQPEHGGVDRRGAPGIGVDAASRGVPSAGASSSTRGPAGALATERAEREAAMEELERHAAALEEMRRQTAARREMDRELAREAAASVEELQAALQGWRDASRQVTRRIVAEYGAPPAQVEERAGQRGEGERSLTIGVIFSAMVYLLVCLASICFSSLRSS
ncbi:unnamed protein product [Urochloa humidicola]